jgi:hypothetical protein
MASTKSMIPPPCSADTNTTASKPSDQNSPKPFWAAPPEPEQPPKKKRFEIEAELNEVEHQILRSRRTTDKERLANLVLRRDALRLDLWEAEQTKLEHCRGIDTPSSPRSLGSSPLGSDGCRWVSRSTGTG